MGGTKADLVHYDWMVGYWEAQVIKIEGGKQSHPQRINLKEKHIRLTTVRGEVKKKSRADSGLQQSLHLKSSEHAILDLIFLREGSSAPAAARSLGWAPNLLSISLGSGTQTVR